MEDRRDKPQRFMDECRPFLNVQERPPRPAPRLLSLSLSCSLCHQPAYYRGPVTSQPCASLSHGSGSSQGGAGAGPRSRRARLGDGRRDPAHTSTRKKGALHGSRRRTYRHMLRGVGAVRRRGARPAGGGGVARLPVVPEPPALLPLLPAMRARRQIRHRRRVRDGKRVVAAVGLEAIIPDGSSCAGRGACLGGGGVGGRAVGAVTQRDSEVEVVYEHSRRRGRAGSVRPRQASRAAPGAGPRAALRSTPPQPEASGHGAGDAVAVAMRFLGAGAPTGFRAGGRAGGWAGAPAARQRESSAQRGPRAPRARGRTRAAAPAPLHAAPPPAG